ncbi:MAG: PKD domain-containing protein [Bradymonadales bacterium]|nr:PKD domain-containing protein [Bradymonadales bacterium]
MNLQHALVFLLLTGLLLAGCNGDEWVDLDLADQAGDAGDLGDDPGDLGSDPVDQALDQSDAWVDLLDQPPEDLPGDPTQDADLQPVPFLVSISADISQGIVPLTVELTADLEGATTATYRWNFGDGTIGTAASPTHEYTEAGKFTVWLTAVSPAGAVAEDSLQVTAVSPLSAEIVAWPPVGHPPLESTLSVELEGGLAPFLYDWELGDGGTADTAEVVHIYPEIGTYQVEVVVTDALAQEASGQTSIRVVSAELPVVRILADPPVGVAPLDVQFSADVVGGTAPYTYFWEFDGDVSPASTSAAFGYTFSAGDHAISLTVTDARGFSGSDETTVAVQVDSQPQVTIAADAWAGIEPLMVLFSSAVDSGNPPFQYAWDFDGDGTADSALAHDKHTFSAGSHQVTLQIADANGDEASDDIWIEVETDVGVSAQIEAGPTSGIEPLEVAFSAVVEGGNLPLGYAWDFDGDGTADAVTPEVVHTFAGGQTLVELTVTDADGDRDADEVLIDVEVDTMPVLSISADPVSGDVPLDVSFVAGASGGNQPLSVHWDFGDWSSSEEPDPSHSYLGPGTFFAGCTVTDANGDSASDEIEIAVNCTQDEAFTGYYYDDEYLSEHKFVGTRYDPFIDFEFGEGLPHPDITDPDHFSIEWTRTVCVPYPGEVVFYTYTDDGVRLWVDDQQVIDDWENQAPEWNQAAVALDPGTHHLRMQYYENDCGAVAKLFWYTPRTLVPSRPPEFGAELSRWPTRFSLLLPGETIEDEVLVQNQGIFEWAAGEVWLKAELHLSEGGGVVRQELWPLTEPIEPEGFRYLPVTVTASTDEGEPVPEGHYDLELQMVHEVVGPFGNPIYISVEVRDYLAMTELISLSAELEETIELTVDPDIGYVVGELPALSYVEGISGKALSIDGASSIHYTLDEPLSAASGTVSFWFRIPEYNKEIYQFLRFGGYDRGYIRFSIDPNGFFRYEVGTEENGVADFVTIEPGVWTHVAATWEDGSARLYLNGWQTGRENRSFVPGFFLDHLTLGGGLEGAKQLHLDRLDIRSGSAAPHQIMAEYLGALEYDPTTEIEVGPLPYIAIGKSYPLHVNALCTSLSGYRDIASLVDWEVVSADGAVSIDGIEITGVSEGDVTLEASFEFSDYSIGTDEITVKVVEEERALVMLDAALYALIQSQLDTFQEDVEAALQVMLNIEPVLELAQMDPWAVRELVRAIYLDDGIAGVTFVGQVPFVEWEGTGAIYSFFYEDLDGRFLHGDDSWNLNGLIPIDDGVFEGAEVWSGWMYPNVARDPAGEDQLAQQAAVLIEFLNKTHQYYTDGLTFEIEDRAVMYYDLDHQYYWHNLDIQGLSPEDGSFYRLEDVDHYGRDVDARGRSIPTELHTRVLRAPPDAVEVDFSRYAYVWNSEAFEICNIMTHANEGGQWFGGDQHFTSPWEVEAFTRGALIVTVQGCSFNQFNSNPATAGVLAYPFGSSINQAVLTGGLYPTNFNRTFSELSRGDYLGSAHLKCIQSVAQRGGRMEVLVGNPFVVVE